MHSHCMVCGIYPETSDREHTVSMQTKHIYVQYNTLLPQKLNTTTWQFKTIAADKHA